MVSELQKEAIEHDVICMQDPATWDGETNEDTMQAKKNCNGWQASLESLGFPRCPIREQCLETALALEVDYGVWGGKSVRERRRLIQIRNSR